MNVTQIHEYRQLTELEARACLSVLLIASIKARKIIAGWCNRDRRPTKDEMLAVALSLHAAEAVIEETARHPPDAKLSKDDIAKILRAEFSPDAR